MANLRNILKKYTKAEVALFVIVCIQIIYLLVFNIFRTKYVINIDSSEYMIQVMQIWQQKTLLIKDYYYSTMLTWDMPTLIAVLFYGIFHDVFLAYGLANNVLIILFILLLNKLCNDLEYSRIAKGLVFLAIFTVYQYGYVDYIEELFVNGALYGFRILFMLMLIDVMICLHKHQPLKKNLLLYILSLVGFFVCGISSGIFELGCCILPVVLYELWNVLSQEKNIRIRDFLQKKTILPIVAAIICALGIVVNYILGFSGSSASTKTTIGAIEMANNIAGNFVGIFQLFGWTETSVPITSLEGIMLFAGFAAASVTILVFIVGTKISINKEQKKIINPIHRRYGQIVFCVFLVNALLFCLADLSYSSPTCEYRYWLMVVIPVFIEIGMVYDWAKKTVPYNYRVVIPIIYVLLLCVISGYKDTKLWEVNMGADSFEKMMLVAEEKELETIYIYGDYFSSRSFASFAKDAMDVFAVANETLDNTGSAWITNQLRMPRWGTYVKYDTDCLSTGEKDKFGVFVCPEIGEDYELLSLRASEIVEFYYSNYRLLIMNENYMDFTYGLPEVEKVHSRDYLNWGYDKKTLILNEQGYYQSTGVAGVVLQGEFISNDSGVYEACLQYNIIDDIDEGAEFVITVKDSEGNETEYKQELALEKNEAIIDGISINNGDTYTVSIIENEGTVVQLKQIDYYKLN